MCLLFFVVAQAAIFSFLRRYHSFSESKWIFVAAECLLMVITVWWYLTAKPQVPAKRIQKPLSLTPPLQLPKSDEKDVQLKALADEKASLTENIRRLEEVELFSKHRLSDLEQERAGLKERLSEAEGRLVEVQKTTDSCCHTIQDLTFEIDRLMSQVDQERHQHSIEVRALLRKESEETGSATKKKVSKTVPAVQKMASPPIPALLLLLSTCQKGLDLHLANDWPANEHRLLVRRKFFDVVQKMNATPLAVVSLEYPTEYFLSSKLPAGLSINQVRAAVLEYKSIFAQLKRFEPYHFTDERLGGRWVAFRIAWDSLEDLIALTPS
jgi:hypothetical protein